MAINYWRGAVSNNWWVDANWSLGHYPTSGEPAALDAGSPNPSVINVDNDSAICASLDFTGAPGGVTFSGTNTITSAGAVTCKSGMTWSHSGTFNWYSGAWTSNSVTITSYVVVANNGVAHSFADDFTCTHASGIKISAGSLTDNGHTVTITCGVMYATGADVATLNKTGNWILTGAGTVWVGSYLGTANDVVNDTGGYWKLTNNSISGKTFGQNVARTYYDFWDATAGTGTVTLLGNNTFHDLKWDAGRTLKVVGGSTVTVTTLSPQGTFSSHSGLTSTNTTYFTLTKSSGTIALSYTDIAYCHTAGSATFKAWLAHGCSDNGGNKGWQFIEPVIRNFNMF